MIQSLTIVFRVMLGAAGAFLVIAALLLTETEEGKFQSSLQAWWIRIRDLHDSTISRETAFVKVITDLTSKVFAWLFGGSFWRIPAAPASVAYSTAAFVLSQAFAVPLLTQAPSLLLKPISVVVALALIVFGSIGPLIQRFERPSLYLVMWCSYVLLAAVVVISSYLFSPPGHFVLITRHQAEALPVSTQFLPAAIVLSSMACDFLFVTFTRKGLQWASTTRSFLRIAVFALSNLALGATLFVAPFVALQFATTERVRSILILLGSSNLINVAVASIWFVLASLMLVHRVLWPLLERPIYALQRHKIITDHRRIVLCAGVALLSVASPSVGRTAKKVFTALHPDGDEKTESQSASDKK